MIPPAQKDKLIDELIKENQDATIKDYQGWIDEFEQIERATKERAGRIGILELITHKKTA